MAINHNSKAIIKKDIINKTYEIVAIFKLINRFFWKNKIGYITMVLLPLSFMAIYFVVGSSNANYISGLASYISLGVLPVVLISLPQLLIGLKNSILLRRVATSDITPMKYNFIMFVYFFLLSILSTILTLSLFFIILSTSWDSETSSVISNIRWGDFVFAALSLYFVTILLGISLSAIFKTSNGIQLSSVGLIILSLLLSGQMIPLFVIAEVDAIKYLSLFSPISYSLNLLNNVFALRDYIDIETGQLIERVSGIFELTKTSFYYQFTQEVNPSVISQISIYVPWQKSLNIIMPFLLGGGFAWLSIWKFSWSAR